MPVCVLSVCYGNKGSSNGIEDDGLTANRRDMEFHLILKWLLSGMVTDVSVTPDTHRGSPAIYSMGPSIDRCVFGWRVL